MTNAKTLYDKLWDMHCVDIDEQGNALIYIDRHIIHEITSPQAFDGLAQHQRDVWRIDTILATPDHQVPTYDRQLGLEGFTDPIAKLQVETLAKNCADHGIKEFPLSDHRQGVVHVVGPEAGITQPGTTIVCGDSHTSTHGAFGALAFGIGTSQVADVLATQTMAMSKLKVRKIEFTGSFKPGVYAKDAALAYINLLGVNGGVGYAYEFSGEIVDRMSMEERMTLCNMSVEGGARCGYVNPDQTTYEYLEGKTYSPKDEAWDRKSESA